MTNLLTNAYMRAYMSTNICPRLTYLYAKFEQENIQNRVIEAVLQSNRVNARPTIAKDMHTTSTATDSTNKSENIYDSRCLHHRNLATSNMATPTTSAWHANHIPSRICEGGLIQMSNILVNESGQMLATMVLNSWLMRLPIRIEIWKW